MITRSLLLVILSIGIFIPNAHAGEFGFVVDRNNKLFIKYDGEIKKGDATKIRQLLMRERYNSLYTSGLTISSPGGSVDEALKISELIENSGLKIYVEQDRLCASSCFFIYVSAPARWSDGTIVIHRPYYNMSVAGGSEGASYEREYRAAFAKTRAYLSERLVPDYLINIMMTKNSSQGYTLNKKDIFAIDFVSPAVYEYLVQVCHLPNDRLPSNEETEILTQCTDQYLLQTRLRFLFGKDHLVARDNFEQLKKYTKRISKDPSYPEKSKYFIPSLKVIVDTQPPQLWLNLAEKAYSGAQ